MSEQRITRKDQILKAACIEFSEQGFASARIEQIARRAGIGKSTVYEYFPSKMKLLEGAADWMLTQVSNDIVTIMQSDHLFADKMRKYILYICNLLQEVGPGMIYMREEKTIAVEIMKHWGMRFFEITLDSMTTAVQKAKDQGELRADADAKTIAQVVCYLPSPALVADITHGNDRAVDDVINLLMRGIGVPI